MKTNHTLQKQIKYFGGVGLIWLILSLALIQFLEDSPSRSSSQRGVFIFWSLSILDLFVLRMVFFSALEERRTQSRNRGQKSVQLWIWGPLKLICMGLFIGVLLEGQKITLLGYLTGIGTLWIVPLAGGFLWHLRERKGK